MHVECDVCRLAAIKIGKFSPEDGFWRGHNYNNQIIIM